MGLQFVTFLKMGQPQPFLFFTINRCEKISIQYTVLGFEPMTFET